MTAARGHARAGLEPDFRTTATLRPMVRPRRSSALASLSLLGLAVSCQGVSGERAPQIGSVTLDVAAEFFADCDLQANSSLTKITSTRCGGLTVELQPVQRGGDAKAYFDRESEELRRSWSALSDRRLEIVVDQARSDLGMRAFSLRAYDGDTPHVFALWPAENPRFLSHCSAVYYPPEPTAAQDLARCVELLNVLRGSEDPAAVLTAPPRGRSSPKKGPDPN